jgi:DNA-binding XRE family transcriptional regulator
MSLNERISKVIEYSQLTSSEFADEIDVQRSSISHITSEETNHLWSLS